MEPRSACLQVFIPRARRTAGLWVYGQRGHMLHDIHMPSPEGKSYNAYRAVRTKSTRTAAAATISLRWQLHVD
jgi:hypothetical protein